MQMHDEALKWIIF